MLSYIDGIPLAGSAPEIKQGDCRQIGALLARLDAGLAGFHHPAQQRRLLWDLSLAAELRPKLAAVDDRALLALALEALDRFEAEALPAFAAIPRQVIHNDLNPHNLILSGSDPFAIAGIIDFGDMLEAPRANDVAVAASYHFQRGLEAPAALIAGYRGIAPMTEQELSLVPLLIAARSVLTVAITSWRAKLYPENRAYIQRNLPAAAHTLTALSGDGRRRLEDQIATFCKQGS
jgi:Ser/Thr protein kinase RdoA (MazF antagonist)